MKNITKCVFYFLFITTTIMLASPRYVVIASAAAAAAAAPPQCNLIVDVHPKFPSDCTVDAEKKHFECKSLDFDIGRPLVNGTCIRILHDLEALPFQRVISVDDITGFDMRSYPSNATFRVKCNDGDYINSGFKFHGTRLVSVTNIEFQDCGHKNPSSVWFPVTKERVPIHTAFYFDSITHLTLSGVRFVKSYGYAVVMYNAYGRIELDGLLVSSNKQYHFQNKVGTRVPGYSSGGGVYLEYNEWTDQEGGHPDSNVTITNSNFTENQADFNSLSTGAGVSEQHIGFGRGGAISVFYLAKVQRASLLVSNCSFNTNKAAWGGAVYVRFRNQSSQNTIVIEKSRFIENYATLSGGALFLTETQLVESVNTLRVENSHFNGNIAVVGGAVAIKRLTRNDIKNKHFTYIIASLFSGNFAQVGYALNLEQAAISMLDVNFTYNNGADDSSKGAVYAFRSEMHLRGVMSIKGNHNNAIISDCTSIHIPGDVTFEGNIAENGGALTLYGESQIYLYETTKILFLANRAWRRGGAIFVQLPGPSINHNVVMGLKFDRCFIQFAGGDSFNFDNSVRQFAGSVSFTNNTAAITGDSIFITSLAACNSTSYGIQGTLTGWPNFTFQSSTNRSHLVTRAVRIKTNNSDWEKAPGKLFTPKIILFDQRGNHVREQINIEIPKNLEKPLCTVRLETNPRFVVTNYDNISLALLGNNQPQNKCTFNMTVSLAWNNFTSITMHNLELKPCYFGYTFRNESCRCLMQKNQAKGIAFCLKGDTYLYDNRWAYQNQIAYKTDDEITVPCPPGYCKKCSKNDTITHNECRYNQSRQCADKRDQNSKICGSCAKGYSVALGSETCVSCGGNAKYNVFGLVPLILAFFTTVDLVIIWLDIDLYSNYINGFLYYSQIVKILPPSSFVYWQPMGFIFNFINMDSPGGTFPAMCFISGFNNLHKQMMNYAYPTIMLLILWFIGCLAKSPNSFFAKRNMMKSFTIISVVAYGDITRVTFMLLNSSRIDPMSNTNYVWVHGDSVFFGKDHLPYAVIALFFAVFVVLGFPMVLMFHSKLMALKFENNPFAKLITVFGYFDYCYKQKCLLFTSFYFLARAVLLGIHTFMTDDLLSSTLECLCCCIVCAIFAYSDPYKDRWMNFFDLLTLIDLMLVSVLSLMMRNFTATKQKTFATLINLLMLVPFILVSGRILIVYGKKLKEWISKKIERSGGMCITLFFLLISFFNPLEIYPGNIPGTYFKGRKFLRFFYPNLQKSIIGHSQKIFPAKFTILFLTYREK